MSLATHCRINSINTWARKNYFYPDLPKGYQITQYSHPIAEGGYVDIEIDGSKNRIGITRIHMEEDAGKSLHDESGPSSYVDLNRAGVPLIEIVSEPDMRNTDEAVHYLRRLHEILVYLEICDGNMEEGSFRCDANISLRPKGQQKFGTRSELKNMNSFRNVQHALEYEIRRQRAILEGGGIVVQETRLWDVSQGATHSMRGKEEAHDYRYFPEPDLVPVVISDEWIEEVRRVLPELPMEKRERFVEQYGIPTYDAGVLTASLATADYYEETARLCGKPKLASNWIMGNLLAYLNEEKLEVTESPITPQTLADLINMIDEGTISGKIAKDVFEDMCKSGKGPKEIVDKRGLLQISDASKLEKIVEAVLEANPGQLEQYKSGKVQLFGFFVGQTMKATNGKANPGIVNELLKKRLSSS